MLLHKYTLWDIQVDMCVHDMSGICFKILVAKNGGKSWNKIGY